MARPWLATGAQPNAIVAGDFDRDGIVDLATANVIDHSVSVMRGLGGGKFANRTDYPGGARGGLAAADFDHDGKLDLVTGDTYGPVVLAGNDDGSFQTPVSKFTTYGNEQFTQFATGDFNHDGNPDIAAVGVVLMIGLGKGDGTFMGGATYPIDGAARQISAVDLNGDGVLDLVIGAGSDIDIVLGNGDGTFAGKLSYPTYADLFAIGDVTGDGIPDLALSSGVSPGISVAPGLGNGAFDTHLLVAASSFVASTVALIDVDGDGALDLVATDGRRHAVLVRNQGAGMFAAPVDYPVAASPTISVATDLDGDGRSDLAIVATEANTVSLLFANGDGSFGTPTQFTAAAGPIALALGDVDGDHRLDAVVLASQAGSVSILPGTVAGGFAAKHDGAVGTTPQGLAVADFDGDGNLDVAATSTTGVSVLRGKGDGNVEPKQQFATDVSSPYVPSSLVAADFTSDGKPDLIMAVHDRAFVLPNAGDGTFPTASSAFDAPDTIIAMISTDIDGNGTPDIVAITDFNIVTYASNGAGGFQLLQTISLPHQAFSVAAGDLDHDGKIDLAVGMGGATSGADSPVAVFLGVGGGMVGAPMMYSAGTNPRYVTLGDLDGDGVLDIIVASMYENTLSVLRGTGHGAFEPRVVYAAGESPTSVAVGDLDGDGHADLIAANQGGTVGVLLASGTCH